MKSGGEGGIRTPGTLSGTSVFKTDCFNRSHTSPRAVINSLSALENWGAGSEPTCEDFRS